MKRIRVLLADDHSIVRKGLRMHLQDEQFEIIGEAASGREAVQLAESENPDVIIMDIGMPGMTGIEATAQIVKRNPKAGVVIFNLVDRRIAGRARRRRAPAAAGRPGRTGHPDPALHGHGAHHSGGQLELPVRRLRPADRGQGTGCERRQGRRCVRRGRGPGRGVSEQHDHDARRAVVRAEQQQPRQQQ